EQKRLANAGGLRDLPSRGAVEALLGEQRGRGCDDAGLPLRTGGPVVPRYLVRFDDRVGHVSKCSLTSYQRVPPLSSPKYHANTVIAGHHFTISRSAVTNRRFSAVVRTVILIVRSVSPGIAEQSRISRPCSRSVCVTWAAGIGGGNSTRRNFAAEGKTCRRGITLNAL